LIIASTLTNLCSYVQDSPSTKNKLNNTKNNYYSSLFPLPFSPKKKEILSSKTIFNVHNAVLKNAFDVLFFTICFVNLFNFLLFLFIFIFLIAYYYFQRIYNRLSKYKENDDKIIGIGKVNTILDKEKRSYFMKNIKNELEISEKNYVKIKKDKKRRNINLEREYQKRLEKTKEFRERKINNLNSERKKDNKSTSITESNGSSKRKYGEEVDYEYSVKDNIRNNNNNNNYNYNYNYNNNNYYNNNNNNNNNNRKVIDENENSENVNSKLDELE
jgi:hypothetical protein